MSFYSSHPDHQLGFRIRGTFPPYSPVELEHGVQAERAGDGKYPRELEKCSMEYLSEIGVVPITTLGQSKLVSLGEFFTIRRERIKRYRSYYELNPPMAVLDQEDPFQEMTRYVAPVPREIVSKGAKFLFGKGRFEGVDAFVFEKDSKAFQETWRKFWNDNKMSTLLFRLAKTALWSGDAYLRFAATSLHEVTIMVPEKEDQDPDVSVKKKDTEIVVTILESEHMHAVTAKDNPQHVIVWVYQFMREDGTFYREEIYRDMTLVYEGVKFKLQDKDKVQKAKRKKINIEGSGIQEIEIETPAEFVQFTLVKIIPYEEFDEFPLVQFVNDPDNDLYGTSIYHGLEGKFDALNGIFTRSLHALDNQATPVLIMKGVKETTGQDVKTADAIWYLENEKADVDVLQWDGTPEPVFKFIDRIEKHIYRLAGVPRASDLENFTNVSGEALQIINTDIIDTTYERRIYYEEGFKQMVKLVRKAVGNKKPIEESMSIKWGPVFPENPDKKMQTLQTMFRDGILPAAYVIEASPMIPYFDKAELMEIAEEREEENMELKRQAITAQIQGGGGGQGKRVAQRVSGTAPERGKGKKGPSEGGSDD